MTMDELLSRAKQNSGEEPEEESVKETRINSSEFVDIVSKPGEELLTYHCKKPDRDKLAHTLGDEDVELVQISNGKPVLIVHSKHGAMHGNYSLSANSASKMLKSIEIPVTTSTTKGDGGVILSIEKIREGLSIIDYIAEGMFSTEAAAFLWMTIEGKIKPCNILVIGNGADRIELLNALSVFVPSHNRVAVVNGVAHAPHWNEVDMPFEKAVEKASEMKFNRIIGEMQPKRSNVLHFLEGGLKGIVSMPGNTCAEAVQLLQNTIGRTVNAIDVVVSIHSINGVKLAEICEVVRGRPYALYAVESGQMARVRLESQFVNNAVHHGCSKKAIETELEDKKRQIENLLSTGRRSNKDIRRAIKQWTEA
ncbi:hypothetical protein HY571_00990 [Candidatus Micrarchaeota archaeon]|nr:hypothetical protein [Candidatus Micrarchaeota archaeon]